MKHLLKVLIAILISQSAFSQSYQSEFQKHFQSNDTISQLKVLLEWESYNPKDPELYTSYFNYYFHKSQKEVVSLTQDEPSGDGFIIKDSLNQVAGYLGSQIIIDQTEMKKALDKIDEGIKLYPNRLDMRFGKIYALGQVPDWDSFTNEIIKTIQYSSTNNNNWIWTNNEQKEGGAKEFLLDIQTYQLQLYDTGNDDLLINMRDISNEVLKYYPDHIESLTNLSITYLLTSEYDNAIKHLLKAEKFAPQDYIVLSNIAHCYKLKGDKAKALEYYEKTIKFGNDEAKEFAKQQIQELNN